MNKLSIILIFCLSLNAQILKDSELKNIKQEKVKSSLEADLDKDSWINPLSINVDISKKSTSKQSRKIISLDFKQDIFKSGAIFYTIQKANKTKKLSLLNYENSIEKQSLEAIKLTLEIKKIDLQIKKQEYLIKNKNLEIQKKQAQYLNGTIDIETLDTKIIANNNLKNQIEDLEIYKYDLITRLKIYSDISYSNINPEILSLLSLEEFLNKNKTLIINKLESEISHLSQKVINSSYLPKVSIYSQLAYEKQNDENIDDKTYTYGLSISIPLDYNMNKNKQLSKIKYQIFKTNENLQKEKEKNTYVKILSTLKHINNKIINTESTIEKFKSIYALTNDLVLGFLKTKEDLKTIKNRLESSKLDIKILNIDKQILIYEINKIRGIKKYL